MKTKTDAPVEAKQRTERRNAKLKTELGAVGAVGAVEAVARAHVAKPIKVEDNGKVGTPRT